MWADALEQWPLLSLNGKHSHYIIYTNNIILSSLYKNILLLARTAFLTAVEPLTADSERTKEFFIKAPKWFKVASLTFFLKFEACIVYIPVSFLVVRALNLPRRF